MAKEKNEAATNATDNTNAASWAPPAPLKYRLELRKSKRNPIDQLTADALVVNIIDASRKGVSLEEYAKALFLMPDSAPVSVSAPPKEKSLEARALGAVQRINEKAWSIYADAAIEKGVDDFPQDCPAIRSAYGAGVTSTKASSENVGDAKLAALQKMIKGG